MTRLIFISILGLLNTNPNYNVSYDSNYKESNSFSYDKNKKLTWNDFAERSGNYNIAAQTASGISYSVVKINNVLNVKVICFFDRTQSIVISGNKKDHILIHEQRHFDITYIYAVKFMNRLKQENALTYEKIDYKKYIV